MAVATVLDRISWENAGISDGRTTFVLNRNAPS